MTERASSQRNWAEESKSFDTVADLYEAHRPAYPQDIVDAVLSLTGLRPASRILEIGSGTGKATELFASRGLSVHCIEPGKHLVSVARWKLRRFPGVTFEAVRFENWPEQIAAYDLAISAQAFHWVPQPIGYQKVARALKPHGHLALFWNMYPGMEGALAEDLALVYQERAPGLAERRKPFEEVIAERKHEIETSGCFGRVTVRRFAWSQRYDTRQYLGLLNTYSDHLVLPEQVRTSLLQGVAEVIRRHGGFIEKPYLATLYVAQVMTKDKAR
jgi:SAM-dependent methyltransferase